MKKLILFSAILFLFTSCGKSGYIVSGNIKEAKLRIDHKMTDEKTIITDQSTIKNIINLIGSSKPAESHKCAASAIIEFVTEDDKTITVQLLPGHDDKFYEFRAQRQHYKVARKAFFEVNEFQENKEKLTR